MNSLRKSRHNITHSIFLVVAALTFAGCGPVNIGSDKCDVSSCSALPKPTPTQCADGTAAAPTGACVKSSDGSCVWEVSTCSATCTPGATKPADDGCNQCTCTAEGKWACTLMACTTCTPGATKPSDDGCNQCTCTADGKWACTLMGCDTTCLYQGVRYADGAEFKSSEGCCQCSAGSVKCSSDPTTCNGSCVVDGKSYPNGASVPSGDSCNTCSCYQGQVACTTMGCGDPAPCAESDCGAKPHSVPYTCSDGSTGGFTGQCLRDSSGACNWEVRTCPECKEGETKHSSNWCETCTCTAEGTWSCSLVLDATDCTPPSTCTSDECGARPKCATYTCADGSIAGCTDNCYRDATGVCTWEIRSCPGACNLGEQKVADDGCNTCTCTNTGDWACTDKSCGNSCVYNGTTYPVGKTFPSTDGCNNCSCTADGKVACTELSCSGACAIDQCKDPKPTGIAYQCDDGSLGGPTGICMRNSDGTCSWENRSCSTKCTPGATTKSADGCSTCVCGANGEYTCTQGQCSACSSASGFVDGTCPACTVGANQTCNDEPMNALAGSCVRNLCVCEDGFAPNPETGKCKQVVLSADSVCTPNLNQTCNGNLEVSSYQGRCMFDGTCVCIENNVLDPTTGKCLRRTT